MASFRKLPAFPPRKSCAFCSTKLVEEYELGEVVNIEDLYVHYFCLLLSSKIKQRGKDDEGILGFLPVDIRKELTRGKSLACDYCNQRYATLMCSKRACRAKFHLPCGLKNGSLHQFFGKFSSFCFRHRPTQSIPQNLRLQIQSLRPNCPICSEQIDLSVKDSFFWLACCKSEDVFHRKCLAKMARTHGSYRFKCPICSNNEIFVNEARRMGFYIPEQEAEWEREPQAFQEIYSRQLRCSAEPCLCPHGPTNNRQGSEWQIEPCDVCGHNAIHLLCSKQWEYGDEYNLSWSCSLCKEVMSRKSRTPLSSNGANPASNSHFIDLTNQHREHSSQQEMELDEGDLPCNMVFDEEFEDVDPLFAPPLASGPIVINENVEDEGEEEKEDDAEEKIDVCGDASPPSLRPSLETIELSDDELRVPPPLTPVVPPVSVIHYSVCIPPSIQNSIEEVISISDDEEY